jgi:acetolactate synthase-1/2/3 large subunit
VVLWLGGGVTQAGAEDRVRALAERLGSPVVTTYAGQGLLGGHPLLVGAPPHEPEAAAVIAGADLLLGLGSSFDAMNTQGWRLPLPPLRAAVGLGPVLERTLDWDLLVRGELAATLDDLVVALDDAGVRSRAPWLPAPGSIGDDVRARLATDPRGRDGLAFVRALEAGWAADGAVVCDMCVAGYWTGGYLRQPRPRRLQYPVGWGTLGYALPAAIGPASVGIPTLAVCGDGGPPFALGELATYVQHSLPVTLLVVDDGGYGMLRFDQQTFGHPERGVDLVAPDWVDLAHAFGMGATEVPDVAGLPAALRAARAANERGEPRLLLLRARLHPPRTTSPRWLEEG